MYRIFLHSIYNIYAAITPAQEITWRPLILSGCNGFCAAEFRLLELDRISCTTGVGPLAGPS